MWGPVNVALWEVPLCALPSDKSSFPRERGAGLEQSQGGAPGSQGDPIPKQRASGCLFACMNLEGM